MASILTGVGTLPEVTFFVFVCAYFSCLKEVLAVYLNQYSDSATALNLRACNHFRLYNGKAAEVSLCHSN